MRRRPLGRSRLEVSEIGFGTWGLGGTNRGAVAYGPTSDAESVAALRRAHQRGITFYDTADFYGQGHSETLLGQTFAGRRQEVFLASKLGLVNADGSQNFSPTYLEAALEQSLDRLCSTQVDLLQLHSPPLDLLVQDPAILEWLYDLKARAKSRLVGISVRSPEDGLAVVRQFSVEAIQVNFNLVDQRALEIGLFDLCAQKGVGVIVRTPLCFGFLTGTLAGSEAFPSSDHRSRWPEAQRQRWSEAVRVFWDFVKGRAGQTPGQFALRFCLSQPAVSTVIPGMLTEAHVEENAAASDLGALDDSELLQIKTLYQAHTFFLGK